MPVPRPDRAPDGGERLSSGLTLYRPELVLTDPGPCEQVAWTRARVVKGTFDRVASLLTVVLLLPVLLAIWLAVRLSSRGPALFRQARAGRDGRVFTILKFRTMYPGSERMLVDLIDRNDSDGVVFKMREDPRVTPVGRVLRRLSLDELPQFINVLTGSMAIVGPRPHPVAEAARYDARSRRRLGVKPGLTGLWQVSGRSNLSWEDSVNLDLQYIENWSLRLDAVVMLKTVRAVFRADGAY